MNITYQNDYFKVYEITTLEDGITLAANTNWYFTLEDSDKVKSQWDYRIENKFKQYICISTDDKVKIFILIGPNYNGVRILDSNSNYLTKIPANVPKIPSIKNEMYAVSYNQRNLSNQEIQEIISSIEACNPISTGTIRLFNTILNNVQASTLNEAYWVFPTSYINTYGETHPYTNKSQTLGIRVQLIMDEMICEKYHFNTTDCISLFGVDWVFVGENVFMSKDIIGRLTIESESSNISDSIVNYVVNWYNSLR